MIKKFSLAITAAFFLSGCASGLNTLQEREYAAFEINGVLIEEKNPTAGAALGILPGGGSFYSGEYGIGIVNLLLWPTSILWDPVSGYNGSKAINYDITKYSLKKEKEKAVSDLSYQLETGSISEKEFIVEKNRIEQSYNY